MEKPATAVIDKRGETQHGQVCGPRRRVPGVAAGFAIRRSGVDRRLRKTASRQDISDSRVLRGSDAAGVHGCSWSFGPPAVAELCEGAGAGGQRSAEEKEVGRPGDVARRISSGGRILHAAGRSSQARPLHRRVAVAGFARVRVFVGVGSLLEFVGHAAEEPDRGGVRFGRLVDDSQRRSQSRRLAQSADATSQAGTVHVGRDTTVSTQPPRRAGAEAHRRVVHGDGRHPALFEGTRRRSLGGSKH